MSEISADFGIVLAYIVPGFLSLWSVAYLNNSLAHLFRSAVEGEQRTLATVFSLAVICLATGMFLSLIRAVTIDKSFKIEVSARLCDKQTTPACGKATEVDPDYRVLTCDGIREAFLLAESRYKRPYQFYGNMVLALLIVAALFAWRFCIPAIRGGGHRFTLWVVVLWATGVFLFYSGARLAHYRFTHAVATLNATPCPSTKENVALHLL